MLISNCILYQVSYLIVDEADSDLELAKDPFLEAGISVPEELPYTNINMSQEKIFNETR